MMHQSYTYEPETNQATVTKEDKGFFSWVAAKAKDFGTNVSKRNSRKTVLNAMADALIAEQQTVVVPRDDKPTIKSKLEEVVARATTKTPEGSRA